MARFLGRGRSRPAAVVLAVAWGTLSMMLLLAFGEGLKRQIDSGRTGLGLDPLILWAGTTTKPWQGMKAGRSIRFQAEDLAALRREIPEIKEISGEYSNWGVDLSWGTKSVSTQVTGVEACFEEIRSHHPQRGSRFINEVDDAQARRVLFLGPELKTRLFGSEEAIGQTVKVRGVPFTVVGIMIDKQQNGSYGGPDVNKASIPLRAFEAVFGLRPYDNIVCTLRPGASYDEGEKKIRQVFARRQRFDPEDKSGIYVWNRARGRGESETIMKGIQIFLGMVGAMTLLVAGVGLANMLFVMVQRRTREIGMQMAIGAKRQAVTAQIVGESLILAGIGGYVGIGLAWAIVEVVQRIPVHNQGLQFLGKPTLSIPLGLATALVLLGIGGFAGTLPARRAARLNPVEALRHE
jgi:putative ABC transport system permease protein